MAVIEGHAEHVMDAVGADVLPDVDELRAALTKRRANRPPLLVWLDRLLGMELKLRQYKIGKAFCDGVVAEAGVEGLHRVFAHPELLPALDELDDPAGWVRRTHVPPA
jgi:putative hydrolase